MVLSGDFHLSGQFTVAVFVAQEGKLAAGDFLPHTVNQPEPVIQGIGLQTPCFHQQDIRLHAHALQLLPSALCKQLVHAVDTGPEDAGNAVVQSAFASISARWRMTSASARYSTRQAGFVVNQPNGLQHEANHPGHRGEVQWAVAVVRPLS